MSKLKKILWVVVGLIAAVLLFGVLLPSERSVERSIVIDAPVVEIFEQVNDLEENRNWSPWEEDDPTATFEYGPKVAGVGAWYTWEGDKVGKGKLTIVDVVKNERIDNELDFGGGETADARWLFEETPDGVKVTWSVDMDFGSNPLLSNFGLLAERVIGGNFERGLANLKEVCESA